MSGPYVGQQIIDLPLATNLTGTEVVPIVQSGQTRQATVSSISTSPNFGGTVTQIVATSGLSGGTITQSGTIGIQAGGVGATQLSADAKAKMGNVFVLSQATLAAISGVDIPVNSAAAYPYTIQEFDNLHVSAGSLTLSVKINGTPVSGLNGLAVTTAPQSPTALASNTVVAGDRVTFTVTAISANATGLEGTMKGTL